jgi:hypothetical protein
MTISQQQTADIRLILIKEGVTTTTLQDDLHDHICCVVEYRMKRGDDFTSALTLALKELAPNGFAQIQRETHFLLNSNKILFMKKLTYVLGLLFSMQFLTGWVFGFLHLPGALELSVGGFTGFAMVFVPLLAFDYFKVPIQRAFSEKAMVIAGVGSLLIIAIACFFKMFHLAGASAVLLVGSISFIMVFLPLLFFKLYRRSVAAG